MPAKRVKSYYKEKGHRMHRSHRSKRGQAPISKVQRDQKRRFRKLLESVIVQEMENEIKSLTILKNDPVKNI